jgi:hypothetical protein
MVQMVLLALAEHQVLAVKVVLRVQMVQVEQTAVQEQVV